MISLDVAESKYWFMAPPECSSTAFTSTPLGTKLGEQAWYLEAHTASQNTAWSSSKYCRIINAMPAAAGAALDVPKRSMQ